MNVALDAGAAVYVAMAVTLSVWIGIFAYLWRIDSQARALRREIEREERREQPAAPRATVTRVSAGEPVEK
ncbi:MAG: CcmD family protein [Chloroflexales bacterium]